MGYGGYSSEAHEAITSRRAEKPREEIFTQRTTAKPMSPKGVRARESRDSPLHPASLAVVFALDVTGSMGRIPEQIARKDLPEFMRQMTDLGVQDPQILFAAVGDATCDRSPLQVGQFESEAQRMDTWLTAVHLEEGGGHYGQESYELAAYFFARHTAIDCWEKRGRKGYVFFTGDEFPYPSVSAAQVRAVIGDEVRDDIPTEEIFRELGEKYHVFFLIPSKRGSEPAERRWRGLVGDRAIVVSSERSGGDICLTAASLVALQEGRVRDLVELAQRYPEQGMDQKRVNALVQSLTPFAATLDRDGADPPRLVPPGEPTAHERRARRRETGR